MKASKMEYYFFQDVIGWEDEGIQEFHPDLANMFSFVLAYRTYLIETPSSNVKGNRFNKWTFNLAKKYFPDWIGFQDERCSFNPEYADRIQRYRNVTDYKLNKMEKQIE